MNQKYAIVAEIPVPEDMILIKRTEYNELKELEDQATGDMNWLVKLTHIKTKEYLSEVLYMHRQEIEDFVDFPTNGSPWRFLKKPMREFYFKNFECFKRTKKGA